MKKLLCLLLALVCMAACISCSRGDDKDDDNGANTATVETIAGIINGSKPTQITTKVDYIVEGEEPIVSSYDTEKDDENGIYVFRFNAKRKGTVEELLPDDVKAFAGEIWYNADGTVTSSTGDAWSKEEAVGYLPEMINISTSSFKTCQISADGNDLTGTIAANDAKRVFGENLNAASDITLTVDTNGNYLYGITVQYTSASGATVIIGTSYDYAVKNLKN